MQGLTRINGQGDQDAFNCSALEAHQKIIREWAGHLSIYELVLALTISDRTIGWRKAKAMFSTVKMREGDGLYSGLPMGRTAMFEALASLEEKGIIRRHPVKGRDIRSYSINIGWSPEMLNLPKRLQNQSATRTTPSATRTTPVRHTDAGESNHGEGSQEKVINTVPSVRSTIDPQSGFRKEAKTFRAPRAGKVSAQTGSISPVVIEQTVGAAQEAWQAAIAEVHPTGVLLAWSKRDVGMVKGKAKGWTHGQRISFPDFIGWCVRNWSAVCRTQLNWMTQRPPPKVPSLGFLITFIDHFVECWASGALEQWMNEADRTEYERLLASGRTHEQALREVGKAEAIDQMREENQRIRREAAIESRISRRRLEQAQRLESAPVHPLSVAALDARKQEMGVAAAPSRFRSEEELRMHDFTAVPILDPNWEPPIEEFN